VLRDGEACEVINVSEALLEEIARVLREKWTRYERQLEEFERSLEEKRITTRKIEREKLVRKILEYVKQPPALQ
jgi:K+/H+ antiporter YhaU regulatory subunit KhtT